MKLLLAAGAALLLVGCGLRHNRSEHVELILNPSPPGPATTFELRFDQAMVGPEKIGRPAEAPPLIIEPALEGVFTWISPRSGTFVPSQPLALDHRYELSLRSGLTGADGRPSPAILRQRVETPPFSLAYPTRAPNHEDLDSEPVVTLVFNAAIRAADLAPYIEFRDAGGQRRAAEIWPGTNEDMPWDFSRRDARANLVSNLVLAAPQQPLPVGQGWRLLLRPGLSRAGKGVAPARPRRNPIGRGASVCFRESHRASLHRRRRFDCPPVFKAGRAVLDQRLEALDSTGAVGLQYHGGDLTAEA